MINQLKIESASLSISESSCMPGEQDCETLKRNECNSDIKRTACAEHVPGNCPKPTPACRDKKDDSRYCKYQFEMIDRCEKDEADCKKMDFPMGCTDYYDRTCLKNCENIIAKCKNFQVMKTARVEECQKKVASQINACENEEKACYDKKIKCVKSSFVNAKFRFEKFKTICKYLSENLCNFLKGKGALKK